MGIHKKNDFGFRERIMNGLVFHIVQNALGYGSCPKISKREA